MAKRVQIDVHTRLADYAAVAHLAAAVHELVVEVQRLAPRLQGRTVWMLSSTERGGGVAEMLPPLIAMARELGVATEWAVLETDERDFFPLTKRLHNMLHGEGPPELGGDDRELYERVSRDNAASLRRLIRPGDLVVAHDPQPLGAAAMLKRDIGGLLIWRSHIGIEERPPPVEAAWHFLAPYLADIDHAVFSAAEYIPGPLLGRASVIPPGIDPLSHKNRDLPLHKLVGVLCDSGLAVPHWPLVYDRFSHPAVRLQRTGEWAPATWPDDLGVMGRPIVLQVSRWDRLKGFVPLLEAFRLLKRAEPGREVGAVHRRRLELVRLLLVGPDPRGVADDPEAQEVLGELTARYLGLEPAVQRDVALVALPLASVKENALMVNALQRAATVVVQNSLREGFGLTVAEAMWKGVPVLANSRAVGLRTQVRDGVDGRLVRDPEDVPALARALDELLAQPHLREELARGGQRRVHEEFLVFAQLRRWARVISTLVR